MGKISKTALAFLYLAQIIVIYKAGVDGVYENATGAEDHHSHGKTAVHQALSGLKVVLKRAVRARTDPPQVMFAAPVAVGIALTTEQEHEEHHETDGDYERHSCGLVVVIVIIITAQVLNLDKEPALQHCIAVGKVPAVGCLEIEAVLTGIK